jgi:hypothetical protein
MILHSHVQQRFAASAQPAFHEDAKQCQFPNSGALAGIASLAGLIAAAVPAPEPCAEYQHKHYIISQSSEKPFMYLGDPAYCSLLFSAVLALLVTPVKAFHTRRHCRMTDSASARVRKRAATRFEKCARTIKKILCISQPISL